MVENIKINSHVDRGGKMLRTLSFETQDRHLSSERHQSRYHVIMQHYGLWPWPWFARLFITLPRCLASAALYRREAAAGLFCSATETGGNRTWPLHHAIQNCHIIVGQTVGLLVFSPSFHLFFNFHLFQYFSNSI